MASACLLCVLCVNCQYVVLLYVLDRELHGQTLAILVIKPLIGSWRGPSHCCFSAVLYNNYHDSCRAHLQHIRYSKAHQVLHAPPPIFSDIDTEDILSHIHPACGTLQLSRCTGARGVSWPQGWLRREMACCLQKLRYSILCLCRRWRRKRIGHPRLDTGFCRRA